MANKLAQTVSSTMVWESPDKQRKLYEVVLDINGEMKKLKTWSGRISEVGFEGEVEAYSKQGRDGVEWFVKQVAKEGGYGGGRQPKDEAAIKAMWAIGQSINWHSNSDASYNQIEESAVRFFSMVDRVKNPKPTMMAQDNVIDDIPNSASEITLDDLPDGF